MMTFGDMQSQITSKNSEEQKNLVQLSVMPVWRI